MASRRKYRVPVAKGFFTGGRVPDVSDVQAPGMPLPVEADEHAVEPDLVEAARAATHADELQRQSPIEREIDAMPISDFKKQLLKAYPELATDSYKAKLAGEHHAAALREGIEDDSPAMAAAILAGVTRGTARQHELAVENVKRDAVPVPMMSSASTVVGNHAEPAQQRPAIMPERRRTMPMVAPVTRDVPTASGKRSSSLTEIRLNADERQIAASSFPHLSKAQAEYEYFLNKRKMLGMKERGEIQS